MRIAGVAILCLFASACSRPAPQTRREAAPNLLIVTIDSLRANRVGAYGYAPARTGAMDELAARGVRFERAYATAPITLTSHVSLMTGRYPPGHGARHDGIRMDLRTTTLADALGSLGIATAAFISGSPLDRRFGLIKGFHTYSDRLPRVSDGRQASERPGRIAVDEALNWLDRNRGRRFFVWVHLFEPHAPHGNPQDGRPVDVRYDDEVADADKELGRLVGGLGDAKESTVVVVAGDHGEAFGEHGEYGHGVFAYDITLRVPLIIAGPGVPARRIPGPVSLVDVVPTAFALLGMRRTFAHDGVDLTSTFESAAPPERVIYAESFASLFDYGWSGLRTVRADAWKYIAAPKPELYDLTRDRDEARNVIDAGKPRAAVLADHVTRMSGPEPSPGGAPPGTPRPDPKDRPDVVNRLTRVLTGEVRGADAVTALRLVVQQDPRNPIANLRLASALREAGQCPAALKHFSNAIAAQLSSSEAHLGLASCYGSAKRFDLAAETLREAERGEPDNAAIVANLGVVLTEAGRAEEALKPLQRALTLDPDFHQARLELARALARSGRRAAAVREAQEMLRRAPADAPQRADAQRLLDEIR